MFQRGGEDRVGPGRLKLVAMGVCPYRHFSGGGVDRGRGRLPFHGKMFLSDACFGDAQSAKRELRHAHKGRRSADIKTRVAAEDAGGEQPAFQPPVVDAAILYREEIDPLEALCPIGGLEGC